MERKLLKIIIFIMIITNIYAKDLVNLYRFEGINSVESELENTLKDVNYWKEYLENKNVEYGYYEYKKFILLAQKEQLEISLFEVVGDEKKLVLRNNVIVGEITGDKLIEGDKKTPEGVYDLVEKKTNLDQFYGPLALVTSYPNTFDKSLSKNGHGIWIHGMPFETQREEFTQGCIALDNSDLLTLDKSIDIKKTVLLTSQNDLKKATKNEIALILSTIFKWKDAWKYSDINEYLAFYSKDFKKSDKSGIKEFEDHKRRVFSKNEKKTIKFSNIDISPYPNSLGKNMYKVFMDEEYLSPTVTFYGKKELFLEIKDEQVFILSED
ncbi:MAG: L,D-transpeptidase family protein [Aliarcobacter sp.]|nr:L,D-transpeptidase family protein [Aliarcobacter sp.]